MFPKTIYHVTFVSLLLIFTLHLSAQKSITGVVTEEIVTKDGKFLIYHTTHLPKGKTISGTVIAEPESDKTKKRDKQIENLKHYILKIGDQIISNDGVFSVNLPEVDIIPLQIFSSPEKLIQEIPFDLSEPLNSTTLKLPQTIRKDVVEKITGDFSGDISKVNLLLNEKPVDVLAGNDTELFFKAENIELGKQDLSIEYDDVKATEAINVVDYTLQAGKLNLNSGETTYLDVKVVGLKDLQEPLKLKVQNQSVGTVRLEGGDVQTVQITPSEVAETGIWQKRFDIQSLTRGSFNIYTELEKPNENQDQVNPINEFPKLEPLLKEQQTIPAPDEMNPAGPNSDEHSSTTKPSAKGEVALPDEMNPGPTSPKPPPVKGYDEIRTHDKINRVGTNVNEHPQSVIFKKVPEKKKLEPQTKSGDEDNDCCDELRAQRLSIEGLSWGGCMVIFDLGNGKAIRLEGNKIILHNIRNSGWNSRRNMEMEFDFNLEDAFCNISDNEYLSEVTRQQIATHSSEDGDSIRGVNIGGESQSVLLGSPTNQTGSRDVYVIRVMNQIVGTDGIEREINIQISVNKQTCEVSIHMSVDRQVFENVYTPNE